jgi:hypothetical protein
MVRSVSVRKGLVILALSVLGPTALITVEKAIADSSLSNDSSNCYMTTSSGARIRLDKLCGASNSMENQQPVFRTLPNGNTEITILQGQSYTNPDGSTTRLVGSKAETVYSNGVRREAILDATKGSGFQYYYADGRKLSLGNKVTLPDGRVVIQGKID